MNMKSRPLFLILLNTLVQFAPPTVPNIPANKSMNLLPLFKNLR